MKIAVTNIKGKETKKNISLSSDIFGIEPNQHAVYLDVKQFLASKRQGNHKTKERGEIKGSRKKLRKQKGSGSARVGDIKNPLFRGGGRVFGPRPRDYSFKLNKKLKRLARKSALSYKASEKNIIVLENFSFEKPSTKAYLDLLENINKKESKTLLVLPQVDKNILLSSRNLKNSRVILASEINTYEILNSETMLITVDSIKEIENNFLKA
tara:strand:- start:1571 stop:2203 length:633 start_codon:yes stop_codon:yes gene_type:complete